MTLQEMLEQFNKLSPSERFNFAIVIDLEIGD